MPLFLTISQMRQVSVTMSEPLIMRTARGLDLLPEVLVLPAVLDLLAGTPLCLQILRDGCVGYPESSCDLRLAQIVLVYQFASKLAANRRQDVPNDQLARYFHVRRNELNDI